MYKENYMRWLNSDKIDAETRSELEAIANDEEEIKDRFWKNLEFGTGGLRGIMGAGTNRMSIYTVRKVAMGLAEYIKKCGAEAMCRGVAIAFDSRNNSPEFAMECAKVLASNEINVYIYSDLRPTPQLSFTIRHLGAIAGIMITASHNPKQYNGLKCYWEDGGQMPPVVADGLLEIINTVDELEVDSGWSDNIAANSNSAPMPALRAAEGSAQTRAAITSAHPVPFIHTVGADVDEAYIRAVMAQKINKGGDISIVYTPLYGCGNVPVRKALAEAGFNNITIVKEQELPDGNFPSAPYPNPESEDCWTLANEYAERTGANLVLATDPDSDRIGVASRDKNGNMIRFTGNQIGIMITDYVLSQKQANGTLPKNAAVISTIVSSRLTEKICKAYGVEYFDVYTGFKFIGERMLEFDKAGDFEFVLGWEESIGYLVGTHAREKDAVVASIIISEMAQWCEDKGQTLHDYLGQIYDKYGYCVEETINIVKEGISGAEEISKMMNDFRSNPPTEIGGIKVSAVRDYESLTRTVLETGEKEKIEMESANVIYFELADGSSIAVRPSGTEPKIKFYLSANSADKINRLREDCE